MPSGMRPVSVLIIRDVVENEKEVDKIAACAKLCVWRVRERVGHKKLGAAPEKERELGPLEELVTADPRAGLGCSLLVVRIRLANERADGMKIGKGEVSRRHIRKGVERARMSD